MNDQQSENRVRRDATRVKKDIGTLVEDSVSHVDQGIQEMTSDTKESVVNAAARVTKDVGHGIKRFNTKAQEMANQYLGNVGKKATKYPWVSISIVLVVGFLLGSLIKPARQPLG